MRLVAGLVALNVALLIVGAIVVSPPAVSVGKGIRVGLVFDVGGKNDKSFNEAAYRGLEKAKAELGVDVQYIEPTEGADRESALRTLAARKVDLVIGVGFIFGPDLERLAAQFPDVKFAGIDYSPSPGFAPRDNLSGLRFREQEGSFVVGAIAGMLTRTKVVGFVGGMKIPLIRKFEAGYEAGVKHVCPECRVLGAYAGTEPKAFADPSLGEELASAQMGGGADIVFHAAGKTGDGVFAAAKHHHALAIGVDSDQYEAMPCCVLTSMVKRVDVAVVDVVRSVVENKFQAGMHDLGLAENGVTFVADEHNARLLPAEVVQKARAIANEIIAGKIQVPEKMSVVDATLDKAYPGCVVLTGATLRVRAGTVHALCGENGAGKSTMVKILAGVTPADAGTMTIGGTALDLAGWNRTLARGAGIGIVMQHGSSAETLSVVENAVLGVEGGVVLTLDGPAHALAALGNKVGLPVDPHAIAGELTLGAAQRAEILAAIHHGAKLLILDEPTAVLTPIEVDGLLETLRALAGQGTTIIIVTHKLDEVRAVADDVTVLRAGKTVATFSTQDAPLDTKAIARAMVGADLPEPSSVSPPADDAPAALTVATTHAKGVVQVNFTVRAGEIAGIAGVDGNGQSELARIISGLDRVPSVVTIGSADASTRSPSQRLLLGLAHIHEDRHHGGLLLDSSIADNLVLGRPDITGRFRIDRTRVAAFAKEQVDRLDIRPRDPSVIAGTLSGGNQQKIVVAREMSRPDIKVVLAVQPSRGVDLGAVAKIHERLRDAARAGAAVLVISADLDELLGLCHTIHVMLRGAIVGTRAGEQLRSPDAREILGALMTGASSCSSAAAVAQPEVT